MTYKPNSDRYTLMNYNRCGNSGLLLPAISLGLWHNFGDADNPENFRKIILRAFDLGITHFDLANNYGPPPGSAEINFGKVLNSDLKPFRDELIISTKAGYGMWPGPYGDHGSRKYLLASLDQSLKRMGLEYVDIFYSHRPDPETPVEETMMALNTAIHQGKALYAGISNYDAEQTSRAVKILKELGTPCLIHQPKYNMFERWVEEGLLDTLGKNGIGCIPFSPLAQGLLTNRYLGGIPPGSRISKPHGFLRKDKLTPETIRKISALNEIALGRGQTLARMALLWILKDPRITSVLIGASSVSQLEENFKVLKDESLDEDELVKINRILD
ncbi:MAG: L-glyceraldehyde 3-phosphate reductase [Bacteroidales bacterium]|nr:L-glyceraldehyde 3-phosphate reductase [Bacteroidales bacterium]MBN2698936.1 L-glyceraldehyde 3-phosphate reductase [Bacteroidales bacterium]